MPGENARNNPPVPAELLRATPRDVRLKACGVLVAILAMASAIGGLWGGAELYRRARLSADVNYLASHPEASWLNGDTPSRDPLWPALVVPIAGLLSSMLMVVCIRRQLALLRDGKPAMATITSVKKKMSDHGTYWRVEYQWRLLSGATRTGRYNHNKRRAPEVGSVIPIVYDRDEPRRARKYPLSLVTFRT
jgi:hypothetical protein